MTNLEIRMLGNLSITLNSKPVSGSMSNKGAALLCYLVMNKGKSYSRDKLATVFWDSASMETARYNLRYTLWSLRKLLDADKKHIQIIVTNKDSCRINPNASIYTDVFEIEKLLEENQDSKDSNYTENLDKIKKIYNGEFLEGFYLNKCPEFNDWVFFERERLQRNYFEVLYRLIKFNKSAGRYGKSIEILNEMLKINPLQEDLYEELIKTYIELGDRVSALNQYKRCSNILRDELNISPNESIRKLYNEIKNKNKSFPGPVHLPSRQIGPAKLRVIFIDENRASKKTEDKVDPGAEGTINIICRPSYRIPYSALSDCIRGIVYNFSHDLLRKLPYYCWKDITRIESSAYEIHTTEASTDCLTAESEKIRLFTALERLFNVISAHSQFCISFKSLQWIDDISAEFLLYYVSRNKSTNMTFLLEGCENEPLCSEFLKYLTAENLL